MVLGRSAHDRVVLLQDGPLCDQLRDAGVDVQVEGLSKHNQSLRKEGGLLEKAFGAFDVLRLARAVAGHASDMDVIYANTPKALVIGAMAGKLARKPVNYHLHDILSREHFSRSNLWLLVALANRLVTHVIANSQATLHAFRAAGGKTACTVCYNGFDARPFDRERAVREQHRNTLCKSLGLTLDTPVIGVFGRFAPWKGQHVAIEALKNLDGVHLVLVGDALFGEEAYKQKIWTLASDASVNPRVHFLGFRSDVAALMQATDVVVHCSTAPEPFGRVIVEAMLSHRPVIASRAGGAEEIVEHGVTGLLAEPGNVAQLANCILEVLQNDAKREAMVQAAYRGAIEKFQIASIVDQINDVVNGALRSEQVAKRT